MPRRDDDHYDDYDDDDRDRPRRRYEDDDEYDDRAGRGRSDDDDYDDAAPRRRRSSRRRDAAQALTPPAICLMVVAALGFLYSLVNVVLLALGEVAMFVDRGRLQNETAYMVGVVIGSGLSLTWGPLVFLGAWNMMSLRSFNFAMFACIWAMLPCNIFCLLGIPFGIWGIVALSNPNVKRLF